MLVWLVKLGMSIADIQLLMQQIIVLNEWKKIANITKVTKYKQEKMEYMISYFTPGDHSYIT